MNTTQSNHSPSKPTVPAAPGLRDAGVDELVQDLMRFGPAPNRSREVFAIAFTLVVLGVVIAALGTEPVVSAGLVAAAVVYHAVRWVIGTRRWDAR